MVYTDLNMVRAGVVKHPAAWIHAGYHEIQSLPERYRRIDVAALTELLGFVDAESLRKGLRGWVDEELATDALMRDPTWTQSIAVGQRQYLDAIRCELKISHPGRVIEGEGDHLFLREESAAYMP
jgi:putative transposase